MKQWWRQSPANRRSPAPEPLTLLHATVRVLDGKPSSLAEPLNAADAGSVTVCAAPALTTGAWFCGAGAGVGVVVGVVVGVDVDDVPEAQVRLAFAQSAWWLLPPSPPSVTIRSMTAFPVTLTVAVLVALLPVMRPLSNNFAPSAQT